MKKILSYSLAVVMLALAAVSCSKKEDRAIIAENAKTSVITTSRAVLDTIKLESDSGLLNAINFSWTKADFGYAAATDQAVEFSTSKDDWSKAVTTVIADSIDDKTKKSYPIYHLSLSQKELNAIAIQAGIPQVAVGKLYTRVITNVSGTKVKAVGTPAENTVLTYSLQIVYKKLYLPGDYQNWDPTTAPYIQELNPGTKIYTGIIEKTKPDGSAGTDKFKFLSTQAWATGIAYGQDPADAGKIDPTGVDIVLADGTYGFEVNLNDLTWKTTKENWGIIGSATPTGWGSDQNTRYNQATGKYEITVDMIDGDYKFRYNDAWALDFGTAGAKSAPLPLDTEVVLKKGGDGGQDIGITAGNYTFTLDVNAGTLMIHKN